MFLQFFLSISIYLINLIFTNVCLILICEEIIYFLNLPALTHYKIINKNVQPHHRTSVINGSIKKYVELKYEKAID